MVLILKYKLPVGSLEFDAHYDLNLFLEIEDLNVFMKLHSLSNFRLNVSKVNPFAFSEQKCALVDRRFYILSSSCSPDSTRVSVAKVRLHISRCTVDDPPLGSTRYPLS